MAVIHKNLTGDEAIHEIMFVQSTDPGAVGAFKFWLDTNGGTSIETGAILKQRDSTDSSWTTRLDLSTFAGTGIAESLIDALGDLIYGSADNTAAKLAGQTSTTKKFLSQTGNGTISAAPTWAAHDEAIMVAVSDETTAITTGTAKLTFRMPFAFSVTAVRANLNTASSSGNPAIDVNKSGTSIFSTTLTIDSGEKTSTTAATAAVLSSNPTNFSDDEEVTVDIDTAGTGAKGLKLTFIGTRT